MVSQETKIARKETSNSLGQQTKWVHVTARLEIYCIHLTNGFHVAVRLFSNRSQMTSKCGKTKKSGTRGDSRVCHWCSYHILTSSVIYYWTDARQHGIYLFYTIKKHTTSAFYFKIFLNYLKAGPCPLRQTRKKPFDVMCCLYKMKQSHWLLLWLVIGLWLVQKNHATVKLDSNGFSWNENLQRKQNWAAKSTNVKESAGKINSVFVIRAALWAEKLECFLEYCWSWKNTLGKHAVAVNTARNLIRVLNEKRVADG